jgi:hypothetical protein
VGWGSKSCDGYGEWVETLPEIREREGERGDSSSSRGEVNFACCCWRPGAPVVSTVYYIQERDKDRARWLISVVWRKRRGEGLGRCWHKS